MDSPPIPSYVGGDNTQSTLGPYVAFGEGVRKMTTNIYQLSTLADISVLVCHILQDLAEHLGQMLGTSRKETYF